MDNFHLVILILVSALEIAAFISLYFFIIQIRKSQRKLKLDLFTHINIFRDEMKNFHNRLCLFEEKSGIKYNHTFKSYSEWK